MALAKQILKNICEILEEICEILKEIRVSMRGEIFQLHIYIYIYQPQVAMICSP